ncbi:hypothetical protein [Caballeronia novacaledonica]|uniref:Uncharacterized protein n=1 Tax=Caballeronia novacaledonica TaxID=1544861 RepID=A0AA37MT36_9BURK|nr:hypothetical protein [Caballeronia novacaledonica]GJH27162.1 hypothetical protein CBA19CS42_21620 [Caballeronia novacaledonica]
MPRIGRLSLDSLLRKAFIDSRRVFISTIVILSDRHFPVALSVHERHLIQREDERFSPRYARGIEVDGKNRERRRSVPHAAPGFI